MVPLGLRWFIIHATKVCLVYTRHYIQYKANICFAEMNHCNTNPVATRYYLSILIFLYDITVLTENISFISFIYNGCGYPTLQLCIYLSQTHIGSRTKKTFKASGSAQLLDAQQARWNLCTFTSPIPLYIILMYLVRPLAHPPVPTSFVNPSLSPSSSAVVSNTLSLVVKSSLSSPSD
jgi:hypothetical protein